MIDIQHVGPHREIDRTTPNYANDGMTLEVHKSIADILETGALKHWRSQFASSSCLTRGAPASHMEFRGQEKPARIINLYHHSVSLRGAQDERL